MGDTPSKQSDDYIDKIPLILDEINKKEKEKEKVKEKEKEKEKEIVTKKIDKKFKYKVVVYDDK